MDPSYGIAECDKINVINSWIKYKISVFFSKYQIKVECTDSQLNCTDDQLNQYEWAVYFDRI